MVAESETITGAVEDVRAFCTVVELGTLAAAARQLGETKGSVSRRISRLEQRLGVTLLARHPRAVSPTEEGTTFYHKAREALTLLDDATASAQAARSVPRGQLRLTAPTDLGVDVLPALLVRFRALYPQITVELLVTDAPLDLAAMRVDLALRAGVADLPDMGYRAATVLTFAIRLYAAPDYLDAHGAPAAPAELTVHDLVIARQEVGATELVLHQGRRRERVLTRPTIRTGDYASAHRIALAGGGIAPLPTLAADASVAAGDLRPVLPDWQLATGKLHAISLAGREAPARVRAFRQFLRETLARTDVGPPPGS
ncbi:LysR family transcriptional regulator [Spiribacter halobius]|uniref:LysR family transcriptional regulator n=1 Tax=Sediminicurvatus halobius TaxID=2182432 RepID=A0A2U2N8F2_9GAMM|nr:LysR family transcriptional regulator [Spiribacter halobius]PWG65400.1 LysR family transcriptional regulator [Spiribacter halobius]UEX76419.1 LysR family transcriptional regulator [Spiribacter halobius]